jgi:ceramide glucosyltransferase
VTYYSERKKKQKKKDIPWFSLPGVTILRPLKGLDCNLEENLRSSFEQNYPRLQIIFSVASASDPAIEVVRSLIKEYPKCDARLLIGDENVGINPKVNNMIRGYKMAKYDLIWMYDSNVCMRREALQNTVPEILDPKVGMIHHLPIARASDNFYALTDSLYLATSHARLYLVLNGLADMLRHIGVKLSCVMGKSVIVKKSVLESFGGLEYLGRYLAEDNMMGRIMVKKYEIRMTNDIAVQSVGNIRAVDYCMRRIRWTRLRNAMEPSATFLEPFSECTLLGLTFANAMSYIYSVSFVQLLTCHYFLWFFLDLLTYYSFNSKVQPVSFKIVLAWIFKEALYFPLLLYGICGSTIGWRGQSYTLQRDSTAISYYNKQIYDLARRYYRLIKRHLRRRHFFRIFSTLALLTSLIIEIILSTDYANGFKITKENSDVEEPIKDIKQVSRKESAKRLESKGKKRRRNVTSDLSCNKENEYPEFHESDIRTNMASSTKHGPNEKLTITEIISLMYVGVSMHLQNERNENLY